MPARVDWPTGASAVVRLQEALESQSEGEGPDNGLGDGGHRLHEWALTDGGDVDLEAIRNSGGVNGKVLDEFMATGAVLAGRGTFEPAGGWGGDHHDGVPTLIYSRREPGIDIGQWPLVTYVTESKPR